jgi:5-methyltetrahydrofolate--homocysteine methyltransferase
MSQSLLDALAERTLLGDGAMGTQLQYAGLEPGGAGEGWNISEPDKVLKIQKGYADAGSDCILTNTFGGCRIMLRRHGLDDKVAAINKAAVQIVRDAFGDREGYVIGDIGPFGGIMEPYGEIPPADVIEAFEEQAAALVEGGADAIIIETQTSLEELGIGIRAAKKAGAPCIIGSMAYDMLVDESGFKTMMGIGPEQAAEFMVEEGVNVVALNCGTGMTIQRALEGVRHYGSVTDKPTMVQPNAGLPELVNLKVVYRETPEEMGVGVLPLLEAGAGIIGGCCGSTPDHIRYFRKLIDGYLSKK